MRGRPPARIALQQQQERERAESIAKANASHQVKSIAVAKITSTVKKVTHIQQTDKQQLSDEKWNNNTKETKNKRKD